MGRSFEDFCGSAFWDNNLTWNSEANVTFPDFTPCFQNSILYWAPCAILWIISPFHIRSLLKKENLFIDRNWKNVCRALLSLLLMLVALMELFKAIGEADNGHYPPGVMFVSPSVRAVTMLWTFFVMVIEKRKGAHTSGPLFIFWFASIAASIIPLYSKIIHAGNGEEIEDVFRFVTFFVHFAFLLLQLILSCITEDVPPDQTPLTEGHPKPCPETRASFLSSITFQWLHGTMIQGYKKPLEAKDLWALAPENLVQNCTPDFEKAWKKELLNCGRSKAIGLGLPRSRHASTVPSSERTPLLSRSQSVDQYSVLEVEPGKEKDPSLLKVLVKSFGPSLLLAHLCKVVYDVIQFVNPMVLKLLINFTSDRTEQLWKGYLYSGVFFVVSLTTSIFFHQLFFIGMSAGMRMKASLISVVYKKALSMSNEARKGSTVGEIVNLMAVDTDRVQLTAAYIWIIWSAPLQIALALILLWAEMGPAVLAGLGLMLLMVPINFVIAMITRKLQVAQMRFKDLRIKLMNEVLNGIKVLKLYGWEPSFEKKVLDIRNKELDVLKKAAYLSGVTTFTWTCTPFLVMLVTFAAYIYIADEPLTAEKAFVSLSLFNIIRAPLNLLPMLVSFLVQANVSLGRLQRFLKQDDLEQDSVLHERSAKDAVEIEDASLSWSSDEVDVLKNVTASFPEGSLTAIVGEVGSGKSSLISAMLGEMHKRSGRVNVKGSVAYVAQQAWIQNATVRDNILFGREMRAEKYDKVIESCALKPDFDILPGKDMTEIGEKGINLSGGQKQRVNMARAVYQNCDVYLMDDPLSAVDSHVGKHMFEKVIGAKGLLRKKTRVLVTHGIHWLPMVDQIIVMRHGAVGETGTYEQLMSHNGPFAQFLKEYLAEEQEVAEDEDDIEEDEEIILMKRRMSERLNSIVSDDEVLSPGGLTSTEDESSPQKRKRRFSRSISQWDKEDKGDMKAKELMAVKKDVLVDEEGAETGTVKFKVFLEYLRSIGLKLTLSFFGLFICYQASSVFANVWLSEWTEDPLLKDLHAVNWSNYSSTTDKYMAVYGISGFFQAIFVLAYALVASLSMVRAAGKLHALLLTNILRSPMAFFDTTPTGRVVNRFSKDVDTIDNVLPQVLKSFITTFFNVVSTIVVIVYGTPIFGVVVIPLVLLYYFIQRFYVATSRQLKRIESVTRSPIYTHFSETITGASTIRAFGQQTRFIQESEKRVDENNIYYYGGYTSARWLGFRLELIGNFVVLAASIFAVVGRENDLGREGGLSAGLVGLSVSYALQVTQSLNWMVRMTSDLETNIVAVERVREYSETPNEALWDIDHTRPPDDWPTSGSVSFDKYSTRYRPGLDLVLKAISCSVTPGEKVGIVGRTGAGKSSLTLALFRLIESASGRIVIDDRDISILGLHQLRPQLTILPQDPVLFSGSLRSNLDPFDIYTDTRIWEVLEHAHLKDYVSGLAAGIHHEVGEEGQNLSVGQRQLVCLARALLKKTKILVLDEATAAVDLQTDELIQNTIRTEFKDCTVLTIAHRLNTVMDYDRLMVLSDGEIVEFDSPASLLQNKEGAFYGMAKDAGLA